MSSKANALCLARWPPSLQLRPQIAAFAKEHPLPLINPYGDVSDDEALLTYGENLETTSQLAAVHSTRFQLTVNLKIARHLGVIVPPNPLDVSLPDVARLVAAMVQARDAVESRFAPEESVIEGRWAPALSFE